ncbi:MAG: hypothetical protein LBQ89_07760 [Treponema sp.]|jgi:hypothetical protein|nr:hypothetical protein [Treponema sp.]
MKRNILIGVLMVIFFMVNNQANAQELSAHSIVTENRFGRITWLFADSAASSVIFYNLFKDMYDKDGKLYEYNLNDPTDVEQMFIDMFAALYEDFFDCYYDPEEEQTVVMGFVEKEQVTEFQIYVLSTGFSLGSNDVNYIFIHNTVNDEQVLFCNIENFGKTGEE